MKKIALIILMAVYALAIAGASIAPVIGNDHWVCNHADGFTAVTSKADAGIACNETCNAGNTGFTLKEHQHAARQFHFSSRHYFRANEGFLPTAAALIQPVSLFAANIRTQAAPVPGYILHCVYRL